MSSEFKWPKLTDAMMRAFYQYLESIRILKGTQDYKMGDVWKIIEYHIEKQGVAYLSMDSVNTDKIYVKSELFKHKRVGPHRPRRIARHILERQIGLYEFNYTLMPIETAKLIRMNCIISKDGDTSGSLNAQETKAEESRKDSPS